MAKLDLQHITVCADGKEVVSDVSLQLKSGELHVLMGPNGSGKSSFLNALFGHPLYSLTEGRILFDDKDITNLSTEKKAKEGLFLSLQHIPEIHGVTLTNFLHRAFKEIHNSTITPLDFYREMEKKARTFGIDPAFLKKYVNSGLSGGEKKQSEILQLIALKPAFAFLDEIDSGVDVDALKNIFSAITVLRQKGMGFLLVTHYSNMLKMITPDRVHVIKGGKLVASGGEELVEQIEERGFETIA